MPIEFDREKWDAAWSTRLARGFPGGCKIGLVRLLPGFGEPASVTIAADPWEYMDRIWREADTCPVCGGSTLGKPRIGASLDVEYPSGFSCGIGVWAHAECLDQCPVVGKAKHVPW